jgi:hypothetical protein
LTLTGESLEAYRIETELLAQARAANIELTDQELVGIRAQAKEQAILAAAIGRTRDTLEFARETAKGFFEDWYGALRNGEGFFDSFVNAVINGLNRIVDKLLDNTINGFLDILMNVGMNALGMSGGVSKAAGMGGYGTPKGFAKGSVFANGIYDRPTMFSFADGTAIGEMGEAGAEAVMPLKRGPDGSLGVQMHGGGGTPTVNIDARTTYHVGGVMTPEAILAAIRQGGEETQREVKRRMMEWSEDWRRDGAAV